MSRLSAQLKTSAIAVFPGTSNLEDHLGYQFANTLSQSNALFPGLQKYAPDLQRIYEEMREKPEFQAWYNKAAGLQPRGMMWTQMLQQTVNTAKQEVALSPRDINTLDRYCQAFTTAIQVPGSPIVQTMCEKATKHSVEPGFILLAQNQDGYEPCDLQKFQEVTGGDIEQFRKACVIAAEFHRYVSAAIENTGLCISADTSPEITGTTDEFDRMFILQVTQVMKEGMSNPVEAAAARVVLELSMNSDSLIHDEFVASLQNFIPQMMQKHDVVYYDVSWEAGGLNSYEAMLNVSSGVFQRFLQETQQEDVFAQYQQEQAQHKYAALQGTLPPAQLSEQILTRVHGLADTWLTDKSHWNAFLQQYQDRFENSTAKGYDAIERAASFAAGELMVDDGWRAYLNNAGFGSTTHLFEYLVSEISETHLLHGGVYTTPGSEEETYLNLYSHTLNSMPMIYRKEFAEALVYEAEQGRDVMHAGRNAYNTLKENHNGVLPNYIGDAFDADLSDIQRDCMEEQI